MRSSRYTECTRGRGRASWSQAARAARARRVPELWPRDARGLASSSTRPLSARSRPGATPRREASQTSVSSQVIYTASRETHVHATRHKHKPSCEHLFSIRIPARAAAQGSSRSARSVAWLATLSIADSWSSGVSARADQEHPARLTKIDTKIAADGRGEQTILKDFDALAYGLLATCQASLHAQRPEVRVHPTKAATRSSHAPHAARSGACTGTCAGREPRSRPRGRGRSAARRSAESHWTRQRARARHDQRAVAARRMPSKG